MGDRTVNVTEAQIHRYIGYSTMLSVGNPATSRGRDSVADRALAALTVEPPGSVSRPVPPDRYLGFEIEEMKVAQVDRDLGFVPGAAA